MMQKDRNIIPGRNLYFYVTYWILYLIFFTTQRFFALQTETLGYGGSGTPQFNLLKESFFTNLAFLPLVIIATHLVVDFLLPRYYFKNKFFRFSLLVGFLVLAYPVPVYFLRKIVVEPVILGGSMEYSWYNYLTAMVIFVFGMAPIVWYKMAEHLKVDVLHHQKIENQRLEAELKLKEAELKLLKGQIHPHFLFNTLNNLYSLALEKSEKTPDLLIRLADMLSYIIYDCNSEKVPLMKEIDFINSFLELQKVRYDTCDISFHYSGEIANKQIAPMILHTFIDNAFKHGAEKDSGSPWIKISLISKNGTLFFSAVNSMKEGSEDVQKVTGIGIANAKKRLKLLYPDRYDLVIGNTDNNYSVFLKLDL